MQRGDHFTPPVQPRAGVGYPRTFPESDGWFVAEAGCRDYLG